MGKLYQGESPDIRDDDDSVISPSNDDEQARRLATYKQRGSEFLKKTNPPMSNLRTLRKTKGFTLEHLSQLAAISPSYLSRLEAGDRRLNTDLIQKLSSVLHCPPAQLLQGEGWQNESGADLSGGNLTYNSSQKDLPVYKLTAVQELENIPRDEVSPSPELLYLNRDTPMIGPTGLFRSPKSLQHLLYISVQTILNLSIRKVIKFWFIPLNRCQRIVLFWQFTKIIQLFWGSLKAGLEIHCILFHMGYQRDILTSNPIIKTS